MIFIVDNIVVVVPLFLIFYPIFVVAADAVIVAVAICLRSDVAAGELFMWVGHFRRDTRDSRAALMLNKYQEQKQKWQKKAQKF